MWLALEWFQARQLDEVFSEELQIRLENQNATIHSIFYHAVEKHTQLARLFAQHKPIAQFLLQGKHKHQTIQQKPDWAPSIGVWRGLIQPTAFILFDVNEIPVSTYLVSKDNQVPTVLYRNPGTWLKRTHKNTVMTELDDTPSLLSSSPITYEDQTIGYIMIYVTVDDNFIYNTVARNLPSNTSVALLTGGFGHQQIWASSDPDIFPRGMSADEIRRTHLFGGNGFFDQGDWDIQASLALLLPREVTDHLDGAIMQLERRQRIIAAAVFIGFFSVLLFFLTRRIQQVVKDMNQFSRKELNIPLVEEKGDAITQLEKAAKKLTHEIAHARHIMKREHELQRKSSQLEILQSITDDLKVGVLGLTGNNWESMNRPMDRFLDEIGNIETFLTDNSELDALDVAGHRRIFTISHLQATDGSIILVNEVTELAIKTEQLTQLALYDSLTGLPNRTLFNDRIEQQIQYAKREKRHFGLLLIDLDRFKEVNDTLGHSAGDRLLAEVATRFSKYLRSSDTLARLGGDEFALLLPDLDERESQFVASKLISAQIEPYQINSQQMDIGASIGVVTYPQNGESKEVLLSRADMAMYHAKRNNLGQSLFTPELDHSGQNKLTMIAEIRTALYRNEFSLHYQPQLNLDTHEIHAWEALIRWNHPEKGWIPPNDFIPLAEETGLIRDISSFVLERAMDDCIRWQQAGQQGGVAINLSTQDINGGHLPDRINSLLSKRKIRPEQITLEVTESALLHDPAEARQQLEQLDKLGLYLSIDDFGTGYTSLSYLKQLPFDEIKIDQVFVKNMETDTNDKAIVDAVINLAHSLGMQVVAEGVENQKIVALLAELNCNMLQGYHFARPMTLENVIAFDRKNITANMDQANPVVRQLGK